MRVKKNRSEFNRIVESQLKLFYKISSNSNFLDKNLNSNKQTNNFAISRWKKIVNLYKVSNIIINAPFTISTHFSLIYSSSVIWTFVFLSARVMHSTQKNKIKNLQDTICLLFCHKWKRKRKKNDIVEVFINSLVVTENIVVTVKPAIDSTNCGCHHDKRFQYCKFYIYKLFSCLYENL